MRDGSNNSSNIKIIVKEYKGSETGTRKMKKDKGDMRSKRRSDSWFEWYEGEWLEEVDHNSNNNIMIRCMVLEDAKMRADKARKIYKEGIE